MTDTGKIATMLYALIGMPMTILCFVNLGSSMAVFFRFVYAKVNDTIYYKFTVNLKTLIILLLVPCP